MEAAAALRSQVAFLSLLLTGTEMEKTQCNGDQDHFERVARSKRIWEEQGLSAMKSYWNLSLNIYIKIKCDNDIHRRVYPFCYFTMSFTLTNPFSDIGNGLLLNRYTIFLQSIQYVSITRFVPPSKCNVKIKTT